MLKVIPIVNDKSAFLTPKLSQCTEWKVDRPQLRRDFKERIYNFTLRKPFKITLILDFLGRKALMSMKMLSGRLFSAWTRRQGLSSVLPLSTKWQLLRVPSRLGQVGLRWRRRLGSPLRLTPPGGTTEARRWAGWDGSSHSALQRGRAMGPGEGEADPEGQQVLRTWEGSP